MKLYFGLTTLALLTMAICGAAVSWDGSYYLFRTLDAQTPFFPSSRLINTPLELPVILVSHFTNNLGILQTLFGLTYILIPITALTVSWWLVRDRKPSLFVWAAFGIGFGTLPSQFDLVAEANMAVQLFWPIILGVLIGIRRAEAPIIFLLAVAAFFTHPVAVVPLFLLATGLSLITGLHDKNGIWWVFVFGGLSAIAVLRLTLGSGTGWLSLEIIRHALYSSVAILPIYSLIFAFLAGFMVFITSLLKRWLKVKGLWVNALYAVEFWNMVMAGIFLLVWARYPFLWSSTLGFRHWVLISSLPFMLMATLESLIYRHDALVDATSDWAHRTRTVRMVALVFLVVLFAQGISWVGLTNRLRETIIQSRDVCISSSSVSWLTQTPLNHWSITSYSILLQGRVPEKVILADNLCLAGKVPSDLHVSPWDPPLTGDGWFDLQKLKNR